MNDLICSPSAHNIYCEAFALWHTLKPRGFISINAEAERMPESEASD